MKTTKMQTALAALTNKTFLLGDEKRFYRVRCEVLTCMSRHLQAKNISSASFLQSDFPSSAFLFFFLSLSDELQR